MKVSLVIRIEVTNDAFGTNLAEAALEVERILSTIQVDCLEDVLRDAIHPLYDTNGNRVGELHMERP